MQITYIITSLKANNRENSVINKEKLNKVINKLKNFKDFELNNNWDDQYDIGPCIGSGAFGEVRYGVNKKTKKEVAIKILKQFNRDNSSLQKLAILLGLLIII